MTALKEGSPKKLNPFLAGRADVWFDDRIRPGVYFKQEIQQKLKDTPNFVAVVSPSYLESDFCIADELDWFQNQGGPDRGSLLQARSEPDPRGVDHLLRPASLSRNVPATEPGRRRQAEVAQRVPNSRFAGSAVPHPVVL